jgi:hypothetical protein
MQLTLKELEEATSSSEDDEDIIYREQRRDNIKVG